ncbi:MAG: acylphosphatase [archaeon]
MKKSIRLTISGSLHEHFFKDFVLKKANEVGVKGFVRTKEPSIIEVFLEGQDTEVQIALASIKDAPKYARIREFSIKEEKFQDFKDFKIFNF